MDDSVLCPDPHVISYRHWITPTSSGSSQVPDGFCDRTYVALPELSGPAPGLVCLLPLALSVTSDVTRVLCLFLELVPCLSLTASWL